MIPTVLAVKTRVRTLIEDPDGNFVTDEDLIEKLNIVYDDAINELAEYSSQNIEKSVLVPNVPAGTSDFSPFQVQQPSKLAGIPSPAVLAGLLNPTLIEWKQAGQPENLYVEAIGPRSQLPHVTPGNWINGMGVWWNWRAWKITITPVGFPADFLVTGEFRPAPLLDDAQVIELHPMIASHLAYKTAALVGGARINASYITTWNDQAEKSMQTVIGWLVRKDQGEPIRVGRMTDGQGGSGWGSR